jgi:alkylation response protein AidB-like acyl-CoA dehydrogenase
VGRQAARAADVTGTAHPDLAPPLDESELVAQISRRTAECDAQAALGEEREQYPRELVSDLCRLGLIELGISARSAPRGSSVLFCTLIEQLATGWLAVAESVHLQVLAAYGLHRFGTPELRAELLPAMVSGKALGGNCFSEPSAGSDLSMIETTAVLDGDDYVVNGVKSWVGHAGAAEVFNVYCRTGKAGLGAITCLLVDANSPGITVGRKERKAGVRALPTAKVSFQEVRVPRKRVIGRPHRGMIVATEVFTQGRLGLAACAVGLAQAAFEHAVAYAKKRVQFGEPVISFQGVSFLLADMATQIEAARQLLHFAARGRDGGQDVALAAAKAKLFATDTAMRVTTDTVQVLGAYGYTLDDPAERWMREAKLLQIIEGTNQIQRVAIAARL